MSPEVIGRVGLLVVLATAVLALLFLLKLELACTGNRSLHIDEYFISACAARGLDVGTIPIAGCHDNKGPLIYLLYELIFRTAGIYNFNAVRVVAYAITFLTLSVLGGTAFRLSGIAAAVLTVSLMLFSLTSDIENLALRTELLGNLFLTIALLVLSRSQAFKSNERLALAGLSIGLAVVSRQAYAFAGLAVIFWLFLAGGVRPATRAGASLLRSILFGIFVLAPFSVFLLVFALQGSVREYLLSFFLYPMVYGAGRGSALPNLVRHLITILAGFKDHMILGSSFAAAISAFLLVPRPGGQGSDPSADPRSLFLLVAMFMLAGLLLIAVWMPTYIADVAAPMALFTGTILGDHWDQAWRDSPRMMSSLLAASIAGATISAADTWRRNGREQAAMTHQTVAARASPSARYAYELQREPGFYALGGFVPASSVQIFWALPDMPERWNYARPASSTLTGRLLARNQARNLAQLYRDFARTPPSYILLESDFVVDIPGFQRYLQSNCEVMSGAETAQRLSELLYRCKPT